MLNYILRRLLYSIPIILGVIVLTFVIFRMAQTPEAIAVVKLGPKASKLAREEFIKKEGLDQPLPKQLVRHTVKLLTFDFGTSWKSGRSLKDTFLQGLGPSLLITVPGFFAGLLGSVGLALYQVFVRNSAVDRSLTLFSVALMSIPTVVYIIFLQAIGALGLKYFPAAGFNYEGFGTLRFVALPVLIFLIVNLGYDARLYRAIFLEEIQQDYVRTALAKGVSNSRMLGLHVLKNGMISLITLTVAQLPKLIMGTLLIENFFSIPGLGNVLVLALQTSDLPVIMVSVYLGSLLYVASLILTDIAYALADPRIRLS